MKTVPAFLLFTVLFQGARLLSARLGAGAAGHHIEEEIISASDTTVTVRQSSGKIVVLNIESLSGMDSQYVREWLKKNPTKRTDSPAVAPTPVPNR